MPFNRYRTKLLYKVLLTMCLVTINLNHSHLTCVHRSKPEAVMHDQLLSIPTHRPAVYLPTGLQCTYPQACSVPTHRPAVYLPTGLQCTYPQACSVPTHRPAVYQPTGLLCNNRANVGSEIWEITPILAAMVRETLHI